MTWLIESYDRVGSTMQVARHRAEEGAAEGTTILAKAQTGGRGRRGRSWFSPSGGVYMTTILRPKQARRSTYASLALVAGCAVRAACAGFGTLQTRLKWPNDVLVGERKLAGILLESVDDMVLVGIGINFTRSGALDLDPEISRRYVGFGDLMRTPPPRDQVARAVVGALSERYDLWIRDGFSSVIHEFEQYHRLGGEMVEARLDAGSVSGTVEGVDLSGALILRTERGAQKIGSGEVTMVRPTGCGS